MPLELGEQSGEVAVASVFVESFRDAASLCTFARLVSRGGRSLRWRVVPICVTGAGVSCYRAVCVALDENRDMSRILVSQAQPTLMGRIIVSHAHVVAFSITDTSRTIGVTDSPGRRAVQLTLPRQE